MFIYTSKVTELRDWLTLRNSTTALMALEFGEEVHKEQERYGGGKYIEHPAEVALIGIRNGFIDAVTISSAILHDVIEDQGVTHSTLQSKFGIAIADTVQLLSKLPEVSWRDYLNAISNDRRASRIKIIDRFHNLKSMWTMPEEKQAHYCKMTKERFYPFLESVYHKYPNDQKFVSFMTSEIKKLVGD